MQALHRKRHHVPRSRFHLLYGHYRLLCIVVGVCMLLCSSMISCTKSKPEPPEISSTLTHQPDSPPTEEDTTDWVDLTQYRIVQHYTDNHERTAGQEISSLVRKKTGNALTYLPDWDANDGEKPFEILIGQTNRPESLEVLERIGYDEYAVCYVNNKIVINSWSQKGIVEGIKAFKDVILFGKMQDGTLLVNPSSFAIERLNDWKGEIPVYEGGNSFTVNESSNGSYQLVVQNTDSSELENYIVLLKKQSYTRLSEHQIGNNVYLCYADSQQRQKLFIAFNEALHTVRILSEEYMQYDMVIGSPGEKSPEVIAGTCSDRIYFVHLSDGGIIVIDGDCKNDTETEDFYRDIVAINGSVENIRIAAWIITHSHSDHFYMLMNVASKYGQILNVERVMYNFPSAWAFSIADIDMNYWIGLCEGAINGFASNPQVLTIHTGQYFEFAGMGLEVLYTHEDIYPEKIVTVNQTSCVFRLKYQNQTVLFTGDMDNTASTYLVKAYGRQLVSDVVQVGHHGWNGGGTLNFYQLCSPKILLWTNQYEQWKAANDRGELINSEKIYQLSGVERHLWCQSGTLDILTFPIDALASS